jgi:hypothetical protein
VNGVTTRHVSVITMLDLASFQGASSWGMAPGVETSLKPRAESCIPSGA